MCITHFSNIYEKIKQKPFYNQERLVQQIKVLVVIIICLHIVLITELSGVINSGMLFQVPTASLPKKPMIEGGVIGSAGYQNNKAKFISQGFIRAYLTPKIGIQGYMHHEYSGIGTHLEIYHIKDERSNISHYFGAGVAYSNMSKIKSSYPLINTYGNYTVELPGSRAHLGVGSNAFQDPAFVSFLGLDVEFENGYSFLEFIGNIVNIGYVYKIRQDLEALLIFTPNFQSNADDESMVLNLGIKLTDPFLYVHQEEKSNIIDMIKKKEEQKEEIKNFNTQSLADSIDSIRTSDQYFVSGEYELARDEMLAVVEIFPTAKNYSKLGSIYYKLKEIDSAIMYWDKALKIDPFDKQLRSFVNKLKEQEGYNIEDKADDKIINQDNTTGEKQEDIVEEKSVESDFTKVPIPEKEEDSIEGNEIEETSDDVTEEESQEVEGVGAENVTQEAVEETEETEETEASEEAVTEEAAVTPEEESSNE